MSIKQSWFFKKLKKTGKYLPKFTKRKEDPN